MSLLTKPPLFLVLAVDYTPAEAPAKAAVHLTQDSRKLKEASILDQLLLTPKQRRLKQYREAK